MAWTSGGKYEVMLGAPPSAWSHPPPHPTTPPSFPAHLGHVHRQLPGKSDRILHKALRGLIITINITDLSFLRPFFRRLLASRFRCYDCSVFPQRRLMGLPGLPQVTQQDGAPPEGSTQPENQWCCKIELHSRQHKYVSGFYKGLFNKTANPFPVPGQFGRLHCYFRGRSWHQNQPNVGLNCVVVGSMIITSGDYILRTEFVRHDSVYSLYSFWAIKHKHILS